MATEYEIPYRPVYETYAAGVWAVTATIMFLIGRSTNLPDTPFWIMAGCCSAMALWRGGAALARHREFWGMKQAVLTFIKWKPFQKKANKKDAVFLGSGFSWGTEHVEKASDILKREPQKLFGKNALKNGHQWIHGLGKKEEKDIPFPLDFISAQTLILGTTGSGKTRLLDLIISQAIMRGEAVFIIDPKGDKELRDNAKRICEAMGQPERFVFFNPAFPDESARINPLRNWNRPTEIAGRIATLIASEAENDPFVSFSWMALNSIVTGLLAVNEKPTLVKIRHHLEGDPGPLLVRALRAHFTANVKDWENRVQKYLKAFRARDAEAYVEFYKTEVVNESPNADLEGLISFFTHNREHASKMLASLMPIMNMLTTGALSYLLSPKDEKDPESQGHVVTDSARIIEKGQVAYIGLDSLSDTTIGSAIGSILLADLTAVAGDRYNYDLGNRRVNIYIDECSEVLNAPTIAMLNKGRGAGFSLTLATQTLADFETRLGDKAKARQALGNLNNMIVLRVLDGETQEYISENMPKTKVRSLEKQYRSGSSSENTGNFNGMYGESITEEEIPLFPPSLLGLLPNLHYLAKFANGTTVKGRLPILSTGD
jgi:conjugal transfer pilus assembly protein TraD